MTKYSKSWRDFRGQKEKRVKEWLWMAIFIVIFAILIGEGARVANFGPTRPDISQNVLGVELSPNVSAEAIFEPKNDSIVVASYYDYDLENAPGWSKTKATAASRDYERWSRLRVTNAVTGKYVDVKVNDYGPESCEDRIKHGLDRPETCIERAIDLSSYAFSQIADLRMGLVEVTIEKLD